MGNTNNTQNIIEYQDINNDDDDDSEILNKNRKRRINDTFLENKYNLRINPLKKKLFNTEYLELYKKNNSKKVKKKKYKFKSSIKKNIKLSKVSKSKSKSKSKIKKISNKVIHKRKQISQIDRKKILFDQKYICNFCDKLLDPNHEFDHIIPLCCGGLNKYKNYQALCKECHQYKSDFLDNRIIKPMIEKNKKYDPSKISYILKKIYKNHYD